MEKQFSESGFAQSEEEGCVSCGSVSVFLLVNSAVNTAGSKGRSVHKPCTPFSRDVWLPWVASVNGKVSMCRGLTRRASPGTAIVTPAAAHRAECGQLWGVTGKQPERQGSVLSSCSQHLTKGHTGDLMWPGGRGPHEPVGSDHKL